MGMPVPELPRTQGHAPTSAQVPSAAPPRAFTAIIAAGALGTIFNVIGPEAARPRHDEDLQGFVAIRLGVPGARIDFDYIMQLLLRLLAMYASWNGAFQY